MNREEICELLDTALSGPDGNPSRFLDTLRGVIMNGIGFDELAKKTGHSRNSLYKSLSRNGNPKLKTLVDILGALGLKITFGIKR